MKKLISIYLLLSLSTLTFGKTIYFGNETEVVTLLADDETLLKFPSEVMMISRAQRYEIQPANSEQPSYSMLKIRPRFSTGSNLVVFTLNDNTSIQVKLVVVPASNPEKISAVYEFKPKEAILSEVQGHETVSSMSDLDLMKAMLKGDSPTGYQVKDVSRDVKPGFRGIKTTLIRIYTGNRFNGYVFELQNTSKDKKLFVNLQNLMLGEPNQAILGNVDSPVIEAGDKGKTLLRIVAKPTSVYSKLTLPIEVMEKKQ